MLRRLSIIAPLLGAGACADYGRLGALAPAGVDPTSSAAGAVRAAQASRPAYPDLARLPPRPTDLRAPGGYGVAAAQLQGGRGELQRWTAANPALTADPETFAASTRARVPQAQRDAPAEDQAARSEAWAKRLREAAKPPPPPS